MIVRIIEDRRRARLALDTRDLDCTGASEPRVARAIYAVRPKLCAGRELRVGVEQSGGRLHYRTVDYRVRPILLQQRFHLAAEFLVAVSAFCHERGALTRIDLERGMVERALQFVANVPGPYRSL